jgi:class 3 adenylate cyclase/tetratricopeptide (TPR) repeat protein
MSSKGDLEKFDNPKIARAIASFVPNQVLSRVVRNPEKLDRVGERRTVTAMFVDIAGFTSFCENRDAEEVMLLLNRLFSSILEPVEKFSGEVDKFMGDAAVIIFGAPVAHEDDPQRALASALEIMARIQEFQGLQVSIGINTGEVVAGIVGNDNHREYTVIGDAVNTASRLQSAAEAGEILVGKETVRLAGKGFLFGEARKLDLKGKSHPIEAFSLRGISIEEKKTSSDCIIGRERELSAVNAVIDGTAKSAAIIGPAGTGKTTLINRITDEAISKGYRLIDISAITWAENIPYASVQRLVRDILGADPLKKLRKLLPKSADLFPLLSGLLGAEIPGRGRVQYLSPEEKRKALQSLIYEILSTEGHKSPIFLVCDGIENLDPSTAELLEMAISNREFPVVIAGRNFGAISSDVDFVIELKALSKKDSSPLIRDILGAEKIGANLLSAVYNETGGNPGWIKELLTLISERGGITIDKGVHRLSSAIEGKLPKGIDGIYTARIDAFPPDARETLRVLSVLGQEFPKDLPEALLDPSIYRSGGRNLVEIGVLRDLDEKYRFESVPLMKAAYHSLFQSVRKKLHKSAGETIEKRFADKLEERYEELARHFRLGEDPRKAFVYQNLSGHKQEKSFANLEALHYYNEALGIEDADAIRWGILRELLGTIEAAGRLYWYSGDLEKVVELNERAKSLAEQTGETVMISDAVNRIALAFQEMGRFDEAGELYESLLEMLGSVEGQKERLLQAMANYGTLLSDLGKLDKARALYIRGLDLADAETVSAGAANLLGNLGWLEARMENFDAAVENLQKAGEIDEKLGNLRGQAINLVNLAQIFRARDMKTEEIEAYNRAYQIFVSIGDRRGEALCLSNLGDTSRETGDIEKAKSLHRKALKLATQLRDNMRIVDANLGLALDYFAEGEVKSAVRRAKTALHISIECGDWEGQIETGIALLNFYNYLRDEKSFEKLSKQLRKIIENNNPAAISRLPKKEKG